MTTNKMRVMALAAAVAMTLGQASPAEQPMTADPPRKPSGKDRPKTKAARKQKKMRWRP